MNICTLTLISFSLASSLGLANVNMKDGSFLYQEKDSVLQRSYNSRSLSSGWLGFGWCTQLEKQLKPKDNHFLLQDCALDREIEFIKPLGKAAAKSGAFLLRRKADNYVLTQSSQLDPTEWIFNLQGQLIEVQGPGQRRLSLKYLPTGQLQTLTELPASKTWMVSWSKDGKILSLKTKTEHQINYEYENENLVKVTQDIHHRNTFKYGYDSFHNLESIRRNDQLLNRLSYDTDHDRLLSQQKTETCLEIYKYNSENDLHFSSTFELHCGKAKPQVKTFEFWQTEITEGFHILSQMRITSSSGQKNYKYNVLSNNFTEIKKSSRIGVLND